MHSMQTRFYLVDLGSQIRASFLSFVCHLNIPFMKTLKCHHFVVDFSPPSTECNERAEERRIVVGGFANDLQLKLQL